MIFNQVVQGGGGSGPQYYIEKTVDANNKLKDSSNVIDLTGVDDVDSGVLQYAYFSNQAISNADFKMKNISGSGACSYMFQNSSVKNLTFSQLETATGYMACRYMGQNCSSLVSASFPKLKTVGTNQQVFNYCFYNCPNMTSLNLDSLEAVTSLEAFDSFCQDCSSLPTVRFCSLKTVTGSSCLSYFCQGCMSMKSVWFYALTPSSFGSYTNQFSKFLFGGVTGCTVHFPMAIQSTIGSWSDVTSGFGGTNTTVLFDIVTSLTGADTNTYTRSEKDSTATATAWKYNDVLYYTSGVSNHTAGVNEPSVGDTIYSDSACTTAVTTISSIA